MHNEQSIKQSINQSINQLINICLMAGISS